MRKILKFVICHSSFMCVLPIFITEHWEHSCRMNDLMFSKISIKATALQYRNHECSFDIA